MNRTRPILAVGCALAALAGAAPLVVRADGVHHPCATAYKDLSHTQDTPVDGTVWIKVGADHYAAGYHAAGWDVPAVWPVDGKDKDTSHYDVCVDTPPTTTEPDTTPPTSTTPPETTAPPVTDPPETTQPPATTVPPTSTTPETTDPPATDPPTTTTPEPTTTAPPAREAFGQDVTGTIVCGAFRGKATNTGTAGRAVFVVYVDGARVDEFVLAAGEARSILHTFPEDSGVHTVQIDWRDGPSGWTVDSDCRINAVIGDPPAIVPAPASSAAVELAPPVVGALPETL